MWGGVDRVIRVLAASSGASFRIQWPYVLQRRLAPALSVRIARNPARWASLSFLDEGAGPTLLLVHGNPTWSFYWRDIVLALRGRYRLVVPDHIGCGLSDKPDAGAYSYRLAQRMADLVQLVERLDLRQITLVAHDWGGAIGMGAAVARPERFARFVLMNTAAFRARRCPPLIRLCHLPLAGQRRHSRLEPVRSGGAAVGGRASRADDAGGSRRPGGALRLLAESRGSGRLRQGHPARPAASQLRRTGRH